MTFAEVDRRYEQLRKQYAAGQLSGEAFDQALRGMMIQDAQGSWWSKERETGKWFRYDQVKSTWVIDLPPGTLKPQPKPDQSLLPAASGDSRNQQMQKPVGPGLAVVFYIASLLVPLVGLIVFFVYRNRPFPEDRQLAKVALILGIVAFVLSCLWTLASGG